MKKIFVILFIFCVPILIFSQSQQQNEVKDTTWKWELTPYLWATGLSGEIKLINQNIPVEAKFKDLLKDLKMAVMFHK